VAPDCLTHLIKALILRCSSANGDKGLEYSEGEIFHAYKKSSRRICTHIIFDINPYKLLE
jgi:hypothetical protein